MIEIRHPHIERAEEIVETEREYIQAEIEAFDRFLVRVADIPSEVRTVSSTQATTVQSVGSTAGGAAGRLDALTAAYRETVMAVPHYDEEYGDTLAESLSAEFGPTLAVQLVGGSALSGTTREAVIEAARERRDNRHRLRRALDEERTSLRETGERLESVEREYTSIAERVTGKLGSAELGELDSRLEGLEQECTDLVDRRQQHVRKYAGPFRWDEDCTLIDYLYAEMAPATPVIRTAGTVLERIRGARKRCLR